MAGEGDGADQRLRSGRSRSSDEAEKLVNENGCSTHDFFLPASEKKRRAANVKSRQKESTTVPLDLSGGVRSSRKRKDQQEADLNELDEVVLDLNSQLLKDVKLAAEENARLNAGKPLHPFFVRCSSAQQSVADGPGPEDLLWPSLPFHVTQTPECTARSSCAATGAASSPPSGELSSSSSSTNLLPAAAATEPSGSCSAIRLLDIKNVESIISDPGNGDRGDPLSLSVNGCFTSMSPDPSLSELFNYTEMFSAPKNMDWLTKRYAWYRVKLRESKLADQSSSGSRPSNPLWTELYRPQVSSQICGNETSVKLLKEWLCSWGSRIRVESSLTPKKRSRRDPDHACFEGESDSGADDDLQTAMLLSGPVGCGKSAAIYASANEQGFEVIEVNSSDIRTGALIKQKFGEAIESHAVRNWTFGQVEEGSPLSGGKNTLILFEEVDSLLEEDKGFLAAVVRLCKTAKRPIILTSNRHDLTLPIEPIRVAFMQPAVEDIVVHASMVCTASGISGNPWLIERVVRSCRQDLRKLMLLLQFWGQGVCSQQEKLSCKRLLTGPGCFLRDTGLLCSSIKSSAYHIDLNEAADNVESRDEINKWLPQVEQWFGSDVHYCLLPQLFSLQFPCPFSEWVAAQISAAAERAEELDNTRIQYLASLQSARTRKTKQNTETSSTEETRLKNGSKRKTERDQEAATGEGRETVDCVELLSSPPVTKLKLKRLRKVGQNRAAASRQESESIITLTLPPPPAATDGKDREASPVNSLELATDEQERETAVLERQELPDCVNALRPAETHREPAAEVPDKRQDSLNALEPFTPPGTTHGQDREAAALPQESLQQAKTELAAAAPADLDPVRSCWQQLKKAQRPCNPNCSHEAASTINSALNELEDRFSSSDVFSAYSEDDPARLDVAAQLVDASLRYFASICSSTTDTRQQCEPSNLLSHTGPWHEHDLSRQQKHISVQENMFYAYPRIARHAMSRATLCDYASFVASIAKLESRRRPRTTTRASRRSRAVSFHYLTDAGFSDQAIDTALTLSGFGARV